MNTLALYICDSVYVYAWMSICLIFSLFYCMNWFRKNILFFFLTFVNDQQNRHIDYHTVCDSETLFLLVWSFSLNNVHSHLHLHFFKHKSYTHTIYYLLWFFWLVQISFLCGYFLLTNLILFSKSLKWNWLFHSYFGCYLKQKIRVRSMYYYLWCGFCSKSI